MLKRQVILLTSRFTKTPNIEKLFFDSTVIELTEKVRDLGVILHKNLTPTYHINETYRKATNAIRSIGRIRKYLTNKNLKLLVNALVISRLDYCNSILYGLPKRELDKLQRVQNTAARFITETKQQVILITFKILHGLSPAYLSSLLQEYHPSRSLGSSSKSLLTVLTMNICDIRWTCVFLLCTYIKEYSSRFSYPKNIPISEILLLLLLL